jgi:hypothetical protein
VTIGQSEEGDDLDLFLMLWNNERHYPLPRKNIQMWIIFG